jgi:SAM-dependent methyltransferase
VTSGPSREDGRDTYQGMSWSERAALGPIRAGLDPADSAGRKNRYIDGLHRLALRRGLRLAERLRPGRSVRAVDYGCGGGRLFDALLPWTEELWGLDRNPDMLALARSQRIVPPEQLVASDDIARIGKVDLFVTVYVAMTTTILDDIARDLERLAAPSCVAVLIEQVDASRGLTIERYRTAFAGAGFVPRVTRPIRPGTRSPFGRIARLVGIPPALRALAMAELLLAPLLARRSTYVDHLMVLRRR